MTEKNHETQFKKSFQLFPSIVHNISEIFCVVLYTEHDFLHLNEIRYFIIFSGR